MKTKNDINPILIKSLIVYVIMYYEALISICLGYIKLETILSLLFLLTFYIFVKISQTINTII